VREDPSRFLVYRLNHSAKWMKEDKIWDVSVVLDYRPKGEKWKPANKVDLDLKWADGHGSR
jgi:hypothetical protein